MTKHEGLYRQCPGVRLEFRAIARAMGQEVSGLFGDIALAYRSALDRCGSEEEERFLAKKFESVTSDFFVNMP